MNLLDLIRRHEGLRLKPYFCTGGARTIGYGWNLDAHPLPTDIAACLRVTGAITEDMAERLLNISVDAAIRDCRAIFPDFDSYSEARQFALIDFIFNVGVTTALKFKRTIAAVKAGDWDRAADGFQNSKWFSQVKSRGPEIVSMIRNG
jgi:lysozyme